MASSAPADALGRLAGAELGREDDAGEARQRAARGVDQELQAIDRQAHQQVHDELVFEVREAQVGDTQALVKGLMERAPAMSVPLVVEVGHGASWEKAH